MMFIVTRIVLLAIACEFAWYASTGKGLQRKVLDLIGFAVAMLTITAINVLT